MKKRMIEDLRKSGKSIYLQKLSLEYAEAMHSYVSDELVSRYIGWPLTRSLEETKEYLQKLIHNKPHAWVVDANKASGRVLEKNGFELEGGLKDYYVIEGEFYDGLVYGLLNKI